MITRFSFVLAIIFATAMFSTSFAQQNERRLLVDTHIHYSHDAWTVTPPGRALTILKDAGLKKAFVSSSSDEGTQKLYALEPNFIVPVLRPYRRRGELGSWMYDETVINMLTEVLEKNHYAGIQKHVDN